MNKEELIVEYENICKLEKHYSDQKKKIQTELKKQMDANEILNGVNVAYKKYVINTPNMDVAKTVEIVEKANKHNCVVVKKDIDLKAFEKEIANNGFTEEELVELGKCVTVNTTYGLRPVSKKEEENNKNEDQVPFYFKKLLRA